MGNIYSVSITSDTGATKYSPDFQTKSEFAPRWKGVLQAAHGKSEVRCNCLGRGGKLLAIRHYDDGDAFSLARFPLSGEEHASDCRFYSPNPNKSGLGAYEKGVIDEQLDGTMKIRLGIGLSKKEPAVIHGLDDISLHLPGTRGQARMTLLGLLHLLWSEAELNVWWPAMHKKRTLSRINWWLNMAAQHIVSNKKKLHDLLLASTSSDAGSDAKLNRERVGKALKSDRRMVVVAPLAGFTQERNQSISTQLPIAGFHGIPPLFMTDALWRATERQFPVAVAGWRRGVKVVAIAQIEPKQGKKGVVSEVVGVAMMMVSENWIPVESSYELCIADRLTNEQRAFLKPLRFDAGRDRVFPDFILLDASKDVPMEVFGRDDEAYEARREAKSAYYLEQYGQDGWWSWNAAGDPHAERIPPFPAPKTVPPQNNNDSIFL